MAQGTVEACLAELEAELAALVESERTLTVRDYARRHILLSANIRGLQALVDDYQGGTMEERPADQAPEEPTPAEEPPPPAEEPAEPNQ